MPLVTFLGELRRAAGRSTLEVEGETVAGLLAAMGSAIDGGLAALLHQDGGLQGDVEVLVNGRNIAFLERLETALRPTDQVTIFCSGVRGYPGG